MNGTTRRKNWLLVSGVWLLVALACNASGSATPTPVSFLPTADASAVANVTPSAPAATDTPAPDVTTEAGCTLNSAFVADVTVPDNTQFQPGTSFVKTWRLRNSGSCAWEAGTTLVFSSGEQMGGSDSVAVGAVAPNATVEVSVNLVAPGAPGTYRGRWQLRSPDGTRFGSIVYVQIVVPSPATATPTVTPTGTPLPGPMCTPPSCAPGEVLICPGVCTGGCGLVCVTPTPGTCVDVDPSLAPIADVTPLGFEMGCPTEEAFSVYGARQEFWANVGDANPNMHFRSLMVWRSDTRQIYVIDGQDTSASQGALSIDVDTWDESQPVEHPSCTGMVVPSGYQMPVRGFGKVWCVNELAEPVGWPTQGEAAVSLLIQPTQNGLLMRVEPTGGVGYLVAVHFAADWAMTTLIGP